MSGFFPGFTLVLLAPGLIFIECGSIYENRMRQNKYDYIIVGAGSTGSVLANRLSENGQYSVLLLEAGGEPPDLSEVPLFAGDLKSTDIDWKYYTEPQDHSCLGLKERRMYYPRGKVLGGTSTLNSMVYVRGNHRDFDEWDRQGASGWNWQDVFHYFVKAEDMTDLQYADEEYRGQGGPLTVSVSDYSTPLVDAYISAANSLGYNEVDINGRSQLGIARGQANVRDGLRCSTEKAYLQPAADRPNLDILTYAFVTRIQFDEDKRARWVHFERNNRTQSVQARNEIILSAGAIGSPHLLMLSGIGHKQHLQKMGIPVISDLPVGDNLQDHIASSGQIFSLNSSVGIVFPRDVDKMEIGDFVGGRGPLTVPAYVEAFGHFNTKYQDPDVDWPDIQVFFDSTIYTDLVEWNDANRIPMEKYSGKDAMSLVTSVMRPKSHGTIRLRSLDPHVHSIIDPRFFSNEEDLKVMVEGMKIGEKMIQTPYLQKFGPVRIPGVIVGCEHLPMGGDAYLACSAQTLSQSTHHQCCTNKMGDPFDNSTVVDPQLRVKGVKGLRVADASIMPNMISANTNAACIMIGEKAADIILGKRWDPKQQKIIHQ